MAQHERFLFIRVPTYVCMHKISREMVYGLSNAAVDN